MAKAPTKTASSTSKSKKPRVTAATAKAPATSRTQAAKSRKVASKSKAESTTQAIPQARASMMSASVSAEERRRMIQDAAYYLAEKDGFQHGREHHYWATAEQQIDQLIQAQTVVATGNQQFDSVDTTNDIH